MSRPGFAKIQMKENAFGFTTGDIREVPEAQAKELCAEPPKVRGEKPGTAKARLIEKSDPLYEDVSGPTPPEERVVVRENVATVSSRR